MGGRPSRASTRCRFSESRARVNAFCSCRIFSTFSIAAGDSYNDTAMLAEANVGLLIHAPENVKKLTTVAANSGLQAGLGQVLEAKFSKMHPPAQPAADRNSRPMCPPRSRHPIRSRPA